MSLKLFISVADRQVKDFVGLFVFRNSHFHPEVRTSRIEGSLLSTKPLFWNILTKSGF